jgi:hypothetical protein
MEGRYDVEGRQRLVPEDEQAIVLPAAGSGLRPDARACAAS